MKWVWAGGFVLLQTQKFKEAKWWRDFNFYWIREKRDDDTRGLDQNDTDNYENDNKQRGSTRVYKDAMK